MATKPDIATNLAYRNSLPQNLKRNDGLSTQQKTIPNHQQKTLRINQRNKFIVVNHKHTGTKFRTGFVPVKPTSLGQHPSPQLSVPSRRRSKLRIGARSRSAPLSERTFRKNPNAKYHRYRKISDTKVNIHRLKTGTQFRKAMTEKVSQTTNMWLPSLNKTNFAQFERPFVRPLNAIEQLLNDEIVQPTTKYYNGFREYIHTRSEPSLAGKDAPIYKSSKIIELSEADEGMQQPHRSGMIEGNSKQQNKRQNNKENQDIAPAADANAVKAEATKKSSDRKEGTFSFVRVSQVGIFAKSFAKRLRFDRIIGRKDRHDEGKEAAQPVDAGQAAHSRDTFNALRHSRAPVVLLSACSSFQFGPPIKPYSPAKNVPQLIISPLSTLNCSNLFLAPGNELYSAETLDLYDLRTERMKRILRVRFALKNASEGGASSPVELSNSKVQDSSPSEVLQAGILSPASCILSNDPNLSTYMLPLGSGYTLKSPLLTGEDNSKSNEDFDEFGYQVLNTGDNSGNS